MSRLTRQIICYEPGPCVFGRRPKMAIAVRSHKKDEAICRHCTTIVPRLVEEKRLQVQKLLPATTTHVQIHLQAHIQIQFEVLQIQIRKFVTDCGKWRTADGDGSRRGSWGKPGSSSSSSSSWQGGKGEDKRASGEGRQRCWVSTNEWVSECLGNRHRPENN